MPRSSEITYDPMDKVFIKNRKGQKIAVVIEQQATEPMGLAFVMHGLGGFKEQKHVRAIAEAFLENGYTTITFDTTNTFGESDGNYEQATTTNYYEDLEDLISWSKNQSWYSQPFCVAGHSLGGISTALFAERFPDLVKALAPVSTVISGKLSTETIPFRADRKDWQKTGWLVTESLSKPGTIKRLPWSHMEDRLKYDLLPEVHKLTMPVLFVVGSEDDSTPPKHQQVLFDKVRGRKEMHVIAGAPHTFYDFEHLKQLKEVFDKWIKSL